MCDQRAVKIDRLLHVRAPLRTMDFAENGETNAGLQAMSSLC
jgi:hypothetical protein